MLAKIMVFGRKINGYYSITISEFHFSIFGQLFEHEFAFLLYILCHLSLSLLV